MKDIKSLLKDTLNENIDRICLKLKQIRKVKKKTKSYICPSQLPTGAESCAKQKLKFPNFLKIRSPDPDSYPI